MSLALRLDVKQTQGLVLTPQLQQAIKLLQLSSQDLLGTVNQELSENPFLNVEQPPVASITAAAPNKTTELAGAPGMPGGTAATAKADGWEQPMTPPAADHRLAITRSAPRSGAHSPEVLPERQLTRPPDLREQLAAQSAAQADHPEVRAVAVDLVAWIDDAGYLRESDEELTAALGRSPDVIAAARSIITSCEPTGVGARDLEECLALQLAELDRLDPAMRKLLANLPRLARADWSGLQRICGVDREDLEDMVAEIRALDPRPGASFDQAMTIAVQPDVIVRRLSKSRWRIELNPYVMPKLIVDGDYFAEVAAGMKRGHEREFVNERFQSANWLARALDQRAKTILRVSKAIFTRQQRFLEIGPAGLRPLVLRNIAEATGLHESTVSRATSEKFAETPFGTHPLKYFFTTAIQGSDGEQDHSSEAIRVQIKSLVQGETAKDVLSDDQIVSRLHTAGVMIARRTVAKYREQLGIPSSVERRRSRALGG